MNNNELIVAIDEIQEATSFEQITGILDTNSMNPTGSFSKSSKSDGAKKAGHWVLFGITIALVLTAGTIAFIGGKFIAAWASFFAVVFMVLDCAVAFLLFRQLVSGWLKTVCLLIEISSLIYFGYSISAFYNSGNSKVVAQQTLGSVYTTMEQSYNEALSLQNLLADAKDKAGYTAKQERALGGEGIVFAKADAINNLKVDSLDPMPKAPDAPVFKSLSEANTWLQVQEHEADIQIGKYDAYQETVHDGAAGIDNALKAELSSENLSSFQRGSLISMETLMAGIVKKVPMKHTPSNQLITSEDLKSEGFEGSMGYVVELVPLFFILLLAYLPVKRESIDDVKEREIRSIIKSWLTKNSTKFAPGALKAVPLEELIAFMRDVLGSERIITYLKSKKASFESLYEFYNDYPDLMYHLGQVDCKWTMPDILKALKQEDPSFADRFEEAIVIPKNSWYNMYATRN